MATQTGDRVVVETPARRRWRLAPMGIIVIGISAGVVAARAGGYFGLTLGLLGLVVFVPITLAALLRALQNRPALILDADGFTDYGSLIPAGHVRWQDVQRIEERLFRRRVFVTVTVTDRAAFLARQSAWHRLLRRINGPMAAGDILIPATVLPMSGAALAATMRRLHRAAQRRAHGGGTGRRS